MRSPVFGPLLALALFAPLPRAAAQEQSPPIQAIGIFSGWKVQCEELSGGGAGTNRMCVMVHSSRSETNPKATVNLIFLKARPDDKAVNMMRIVVPAGVFLPAGVTVEVDGTPLGRVQFTRCLPRVCVAFSDATQDILDKFGNGKVASISYEEAPGQVLPVRMPLDGFAPALKALAPL